MNSKQRVNKLTLLTVLFVTLLSSSLNQATEVDPQLESIVSTYLAKNANICIFNNKASSVIEYCHTDGCTNCSTVSAGNQEAILGSSQYLPWVCVREDLGYTRTEVNLSSNVNPRVGGQIPNNKKLLATTTISPSNSGYESTTTYTLVDANAPSRAYLNCLKQELDQLVPGIAKTIQNSIGK